MMIACAVDGLREGRLDEKRAVEEAVQKGSCLGKAA